MDLTKKSILLLFFCLGVMQNNCVVGAESPDNLNRCVEGKHHKSVPGSGGNDFAKYHCFPWANRSCCTNDTAQKIQQDGVLSLYNMKWNHCAGIRNFSVACRNWFMKDTCFYECSPNLGPFIVVDRRSRYTRKERIMNVPLCASDCDRWFEACKDDYTCSDNWNKNWKWTKQGNQCIKECKTFKEYFQNSENFCNNIFDSSFMYAHGMPGKDCFILWPNASKDGINPNENVAKEAQKSLDRVTAVSHEVVKFLNTCVANSFHKSKPGPEPSITECVPWRSHACCSKRVTDAIKNDVSPFLKKLKWNHCGNMSTKCKEYFTKDACFYSCSPNLAPWIVRGHVSNNGTAKRAMNIPLCSDDCVGWFEACKDDYICSDIAQTSREEGGQCESNCKQFKDLFKTALNFCNTIFNHSFLYTDGEHGKDCMSLWPDSNVRDLNKEVAIAATHKILLSAGNQLNPSLSTGNQLNPTLSTGNQLNPSILNFIGLFIYVMMTFLS